MKERLQSTFPSVSLSVGYSTPPLGRQLALRRSENGAVAVIFAVVLAVILGFFGMALDLSRVHNRKVELQNVADAVALAAARELDGTAVGVNAAITAAASTASVFKYKYNTESINWSAAAIQFSNAPDRAGTWINTGSATGSATNLFYVKVDTAALTGHGDVNMVFMPVLSAPSTVPVSSVAIAGRTNIAVTPLAICAITTNPAAPRINSPSYKELVEYGFRRGVSYDLMNLNSQGTTPANFVINPVVPPGAVGAVPVTSDTDVGPYVCAGKMRMPGLVGSPIRVTQPFPLASLYKQLNSRFDQYEDNLCDFNGAPPDVNIKAYIYNPPPPPPAPANFPWTQTAPLGQTAASSTTGSVLQTVADLPPPGGSAAQYGPVWAYAKAVPYSAYSPGGEPSAGYTTFGTAGWPTLYNGQAVKNAPSGSYPTAASATPYSATTGSNFAGPSAAHRGIKNRRVLNVPLLSCPVASGTNVPASVLAIGKFFMTVPATSTSISAEFAGAFPTTQVKGEVELFR